MPAIRYLFDLPVYRLAEDRYYAEQSAYIDSVIEERYASNDPWAKDLRRKDQEDPSHVRALRDHVWRSYGGAWRYNEIIGYIRLHFLGSQVRGEFFAVRKARLVRTRRKVFEYQTWKLAPEIEVPFHLSNIEIFAAVMQYVTTCKKELPGRYIDAELLERLGPHVDWKKL